MFLLTSVADFVAIPDAVSRDVAVTADNFGLSNDSELLENVLLIPLQFDKQFWGNYQ